MKVKDICEVNQTSISRNYNHSSYLYLDTSNLLENSINKIEEFQEKKDLPSRARRIVKDKDILFSTIRPKQNHYGIMENPPENLLVSTGFAVLTPNIKLVNPYYLYYFLTKEDNVNQLQMIAETAVSSYPSIKPDDIGNLNINLPAKEKQDEIANRLLVLDKKVNMNSSLILELEEYSQLLFHKWFVDFNFSDDVSHSYKENGGGFKHVDGKKIPNDWEVMQLNQLVDIKTETIDPQKYPTKIFKHFSIPIYDETKSYGNEQGSSIMSHKYKVNQKNLLVSKLNPWFNRVVYPMDIDEAVCSTEFVVWNPLMDSHLEYLYVLANTSKFVGTCTKASIGTSNSHKRVKPKFMLRYKVPYNRDIVSKFNGLIKPFIERIHLTRLENQMLIETRNLLIKKLIR